MYKRNLGKINSNTTVFNVCFQFLFANGKQEWKKLQYSEGNQMIEALVFFFLSRKSMPFYGIVNVENSLRKRNE